MTKKSSIEKIKLEAQTNILTKSKTGEFSQAFNIFHFCKPKTNYNFDIKLLSLLALLSIFEENRSEFIENTKYKRFEIINKGQLHNLKEIEEINKFISNIKNFSEKYYVIYYILINEYNRELNFYLSINDNELFKYIFQIDNSRAEKDNKPENDLLHTIKNHCDKNEIKYDINNPIKKNSMRIWLHSYFLYIIQSNKNENEDEKPHKCFDAVSLNYNIYNTDNNYNNYGDISDLYDNIIINSNLIGIDIEEYALKNNIKINKLYLDIRNRKLELIIFIMKLIIFQENNHKISERMVVFEEKEKFPVIYIEIIRQEFKINFINPGLSLSEFVEFCDKEAPIILYEKKN